jgi:hypothetical protein
MNKKTIRTAGLALVAAIFTALSACKDKTDAEPGQARTLNKSTLTTKTWYNQGSTIIHEFKANGVYGFDGSWKWLNNSDTLEIVMISGYPRTYWKVYWNTDHEMSCEKAGAGAPVLYKDQAWQ